MGQPDAELMRRWQEGEIAAFEELVRRWQEPIARFLARYMGRPDRVEDLSQEVFLRLYLAGSRYRESAAFAGWLYRIALNVARDAARKRDIRVSPVPKCEWAPAGAGGPMPCEQEEISAAVERAVADLPPALRETLVLRHYQELTFDEMAHVLGAPASTLKSRFVAALKILRQRLSGLE